MTDDTIDVEIADASTQVESKPTDSSYIDDLKSEVVKWRTRAKENKEAAKKFEEAEKRLKETEAKTELAMKQVADMRSLADRRLIDAEIKAVATELGLKKLEYAKLADSSKIQLSESGEVMGVKEMLLTLKSHDPELFKLPTTTNTSFPPTEMKEVKSDNLTNVKNQHDFAKAKQDWLRTLE